MARQSDRFYDSIRKSHTIVSWVDVTSPDQETITLPTMDGQVDVDRTATFRRKLTVTCIDPLGTLTPRANGEILTPYGTELRAYRGVQYDQSNPDDIEVCPLGVFRLSRSNISDSNGGSPSIQLEAYDRSRTISRDKFLTPYVINSGTNALTAIKEITKRSYPDLEFDTITSPVAASSTLLYDAGDDPWDVIMTLAASMG
jgi:hypothetical protein